MEDLIWLAIVLGLALLGYSLIALLGGDGELRDDA